MRTSHKRRIWVALVVLLLGGGLFSEVGEVAAEAPTPALSEAGEDWPRFRGPRGDGRSPESILKVWPAEGPKVLWQRAVGEGYSAPVVADGRLFLFDRQGERARLVALRADTGVELWSREYTTAYVDGYGFSNGPRSSPVVAGDKVLTFGAEGRLRCHAATDGKLLWDVDTAAEYGVVQNFFGVGSTPWVEGGLVLVPVGGSPPKSPNVHSGEVRGNGSGIVAFELSTGRQRYRISDELASYASPVVATIGARRWAFALTRGGLLAFEPSSGAVDFFYPWRAAKLLSVNAASPVIVGDRVLVSEGYGPGSALLRVRADGFDELWKDPPGRNKSLLSHWATPVHHEGFVYGCSGEKSGSAELRCVELATGKVRWSHRGLRRSTLTYADGHLLVLGEYGELVLARADPESYQPVARVDLAARGLVENPAWNAPVLSRGLLYLRGKGRLVCFDLRPPERAVAEAR